MKSKLVLLCCVSNLISWFTCPLAFHSIEKMWSVFLSLKETLKRKEKMMG